MLTGMSHPSPAFDRSHTADLAAFVQASPSPYHAVASAAARLEEAGFRQVAETASWDGGHGGRYVLRGGAIVAWYVPEGARPQTPYRVVGAHTDSPNLRVKPRPDMGTAGWRQVAMEIYGGPLLNSWLDRDLGLAGRLSLRDGSTRLVNVDRPLLRIAQLAIHLDRGVNDNGLTLDKQRHLQPLWGLGDPSDGDLIDFLAAEAGLRAAEVAGWDLMVHDVQPPAFLGRDRELLAAPRLDNLLSVHACLAALLAAAGPDLPYIPVLAAFDHEENGSESDTGAGGPLLGNVLERSVHSAAAVTRSGCARWPAPSASPPTSATRCTPTTPSATTRPTTRAPTAARSSRPTPTSATPPTAPAAPCSPRPASGRACPSSTSCPATPCPAAPPSAPSPPPATASPPSTSASRSSPCTPPANSAAPTTPTTWQTP